MQIVLGSANYSQFMPFNSYIDTQNFSHPKELAAFLNEVGNNKTTYNSYFDWKKSKKSIRMNHYLYDLADKLLSTPPDAKSIKKDLFKWWYEDAHCQTRCCSN